MAKQKVTSKSTTKKTFTNKDSYKAYLKAGRKRVYDLMRDRKWHDRDAIEAAGGDRESLRRMRELRKYFTIETRLKNPATNLYEYRLSR